MRIVIIFPALLLWPLSLPSTASASPFSLHGPFSQKRAEAQADLSSQPARVYSEVLSGCGRGRSRDPATRQCKGPADLR